MRAASGAENVASACTGITSNFHQSDIFLNIGVHSGPVVAGVLGGWQLPFITKSFGGSFLLWYIFGRESSA